LFRRSTTIPAALPSQLWWATSIGSRSPVLYESFALVSHELLTPLTSILGYLEESEGSTFSVALSLGAARSGNCSDDDQE
jgi:signal transduction histidine kinase